MTPRLLSALFVCALIGSPLNARGNSDKRTVYQLPKNPKAAVIVLDYKGGLRRRTSDKPAMTIQADGTVLLPAQFAGQKSFRGKISSTQLHNLLDFIISKNQFLKYDKKTVDAKLKKVLGRRRLIISDAATVVIRVDIPGMKNEATRYALGMGKDRQVKELRQLVAIHHRLQQVSTFVRLGGKKAVAKWLTLVNAELKKKFPQAKPLTISDLQSGGVRGDGSIYVSFYRRKTDANGKPVPGVAYTSGRVNKPAGKPVKIFVFHRVPGVPRVRGKGKAQDL